MACQALWLAVALLLVLVERGSCYFGTESYILVRFSGGRDQFQVKSTMVSYSNSSFEDISGVLYSETQDFGCVDSLTTSNTSFYPSEPFVLFIPLSSKGCTDYQKALMAQRAGAAGVIFYSANNQQRLQRVPNRLKIPVAFMFLPVKISDRIRQKSSFSVTMSVRLYRQSQTFYFVVFAFTLLVLLSFTWFVITYTKRLIERCNRRKRKIVTQRNTERAINQLPVRTIKKNKKVKGEEEDSLCAICLESFQISDSVRTLPCKHEFHKKCIDPWLQTKSTCPLCKFDIVSGKQTSPSYTVSPSQAFFGIHNTMTDDSRRDFVDVEAQRSAVGNTSDDTAVNV